MNILEDKYADMVRALAKPGLSIVDALVLDPKKAHLLHMALGIAGEAGEIVDAIKKHVIYGKPLDIQNVEEELGDMEFYMEGLRGPIGISRERTLLSNMEKLMSGKNARYAKGYSDQAAQERADKSVTEINQELQSIQETVKQNEMAVFAEEPDL